MKIKAICYGSIPNLLSKKTPQRIQKQTDIFNDRKTKYMCIIDERSEYSTGEYSTGEKNQFLYGLLLSTAVT